MNENDEIEIDLLELIRVILSKLWLVILVTALGVGIAAAATIFFMKPIYKSTSTMYVLTKSTSITSLADIQMGTQLTQDYMVVISSRPVLEKVIDNLGLDMNYEGLKSFLEITVTNNDAFLAKKIVDEVADVSAAKMAEVMETQAPNIMDYGTVPEAPSGPSLIKNSLIGAIVGFVLICGLLVLFYLLNDTIKTADDIEKYLGLNTLGLIPLEEGTSKRRSHGKDATHKKSFKFKNTKSKKSETKKKHVA